jgi:hypothetical protein
LWNALKRLTRNFSASERVSLFHGTVLDTYGIHIDGSR